MSRKRKKISLDLKNSLFLGGIILMIGVVLYTFYLQKNHQADKLDRSYNEEDPDNSNWQSYLSPNGYEIAFPKNWFLDVRDPVISSYDLRYKKAGADELSLRIYVNWSPPWIPNIQEQQNSGMEIYRKEQIQIGGVTGTLIERYWKNELPQHITSVYFSRNGRDYEIHAYHLANSRYVGVLSKILDTFRFVDQK